MPVPQSKSRPVRILAAIAGGSAVIAGGLPTLTPDRYDWIGGAIGLLGLVITGAVAAYTEGRVTPTENVEARSYVDDQGVRRVIAGEASPIRTGAPVDVTAAGASNWAP